MPGSLQQAAPTSVFPASLSTSFALSSAYPVLSTSYQDGTLERSMIQDGVNAPRPARVWSLAKRLTLAQFATLFTFWETSVFGGYRPFYFYDPFTLGLGQQIGANYDPTGVSTQGRVTVHFRGSWAHTVTLGRVTIPSLSLVELT